MSLILLAVVAVFFWASQSVILEQRLAYHHPLDNVVFIQFISFLTGFILLICFRGTGKVETPLPDFNTGKVFFYVISGVCFFLGAILYTSAFYLGGTVAMITPALALIPIFASVEKVVVFRGVTPTPSQIAGFVFVGIALYLVSR